MCDMVEENVVRRMDAPVMFVASHRNVTGVVLNLWDAKRLDVQSSLCREALHIVCCIAEEAKRARWRDVRSLWSATVRDVQDIREACCANTHARS